MVFRCFQWTNIATVAFAAFASIAAISGTEVALGQSGLGTTANSSQSLPPNSLPPRRLADGVLTVVPPALDANDTFSGTFDLDFVAKHPDLAWTPPNFPEGKPHFASNAETLLELSRNVTFRHYVWYLEFSFKPVRLIQVDVRNANGDMEKKTCWYMVYSVRYPGQDLQAAYDQESRVPQKPVEASKQSVRFLPRFTMVSKERGFAIDSQIIPAAKSAIEQKERIGKPLLDTIQISEKELTVSLSPEDATWGVAIWTDVDPRLDFFAVDVRGLTNAYKMRQEASGKLAYDRKTLRIYHWRAGDGIDEHKDTIRLGVPAFEDPARLQHHLNQFNLQERLDYQWIYR